MFETFKCSGQNLSNSLCQSWNDKSIPLQILYPSSVSWKITPLYFFSSNNIYFAQKEPIKMKIFETFRVLGSKFVKLLMPIFKQVDSSPNFAFLFSFMKDNSSVLFSSNNIYFAPKGPIKIKILETFKYSGQNSSCQLWNDESVPLQILHNSSLSGQITSLWILSSYVSNFGLKDPIKIPILSALEKICSIPHVIFQTTSQLNVMLDKSVNNV